MTAQSSWQTSGLGQVVYHTNSICPPQCMKSSPIVVSASEIGAQLSARDPEGVTAFSRRQNKTAFHSGLSSISHCLSNGHEAYLGSSTCFLRPMGTSTIN